MVLPRTTVTWHEGRLVVNFDERTTIFGQRVIGRIELMAEHDGIEPVTLDPEGYHRWAALAPRARFEARFLAPDLSFCGSAYFDANEGDRPLETSFARWQWSRAEFGRGTAILYDVEHGSGRTEPRGWWCDSQGRVEPMLAPESVWLGRTAWWLPRHTRTDASGRATLVRTLEDTPFYSRSLMETSLRGLPGRAVHESLDLRRFTHPIVQAMIPYRLRRDRES